jgi:4-hydroxy-2-oxoglutarate aldolase
MLLSGIFPACTTPFYPDGRVYFRKIEHNVDRYSRTPIAGMVILGSTGEAVMLSDEEKRDVLRVAAEHSAPHKVLIAGTGAESVTETLRLSEAAGEFGYDAALVRTPHFYKPQMQPRQMLTFYRAVADRSPLPVIIYSVPVYTGYDIPVELVRELSEHPNIVAIKESSGNVEKVKALVEATRGVSRLVTTTETFTAVTGRMAEAAPKAPEEGFVSAAALGGNTTVQAPPKPQMKTRTKDVGFQVLVGAAQTLLESLHVGAVGGVLAFACAAPTACFETLVAFKDGDHELAKLKQERMRVPAHKLLADHGIGGLKYAMDLNGYYGGTPRLPLLPPTAEAKQAIEKLMSELRN